MIQSAVDVYSDRSMSGGTTSKDLAAMKNHSFADLPWMQIVWDVLEAAKDNVDEMMIAACRRLIVADRLGWKKYSDRRDVELVMGLAE